MLVETINLCCQYYDDHLFVLPNEKYILLKVRITCACACAVHVLYMCLFYFLFVGYWLWYGAVGW